MVYYRLVARVFYRPVSRGAGDFTKICVDSNMEAIFLFRERCVALAALKHNLPVVQQSVLSEMVRLPDYRSVARSTRVSPRTAFAPVAKTLAHDHHVVPVCPAGREWRSS